METNNITQWVIIGAAVLVLIVGGTWLVMRGRDAAPALATNALATSTPATTTTVDKTNNIPKGTVTAMSDGESVTVTSQSAGDTVTIASMTLTHATWVAVRDDMSILGAAWFPSNATTGTIELQRGVQSGKSYRVVMYVDDGDKKFDYKTDQLITKDGGPVGTSFEVQ